MVPKLLTLEETNLRINFCANLLNDKPNDNNLETLDTMITCHDVLLPMILNESSNR